MLFRSSESAPQSLTVVGNRAVDIVDDRGLACPTGAIGRVRISARGEPLPFLADFDAPGGPAAFEPGDLGRLAADGTLTLAGRADDVLNVGGTKMLAEDVEEILVGAPGVADCGVSAMTDAFGVTRVACGLVCKPNWNQGQFLEYCERRMPRDFLPQKFVVLRAIPRTPSRKIERKALADMLAPG